MQAFVATLEHRSLSAAADALGVSVPTVSRQISALERELGVPLVRRSTRSVRETDAGRLYYQRCLEILRQIGEVDAEVRRHHAVPAGELRITAPVTFGGHHVAPALADFLKLHPRLSFYLLLTDRCESLTEQRLDLAVRVGVAPRPKGAGVCLGYVQRAVVGSPQYFRTHLLPRHPRDLEQHSCLHFAHYLRADEWDFVDQDQRFKVRLKGRVRSNNQEALLPALRSGAGIAILPTWLIAKDLDSGSLCRVLSDYEIRKTAVWAIYPVPGSPPTRVDAFVQFLAARLREQGVAAPQA
jgi:DNA-binding transcriptional LysR family regulator